DANTFALLQTLQNPTPEVGDQFGAALASSGRYVLVGTPFDDRAGLDAGAVYLFDPDTGAVVKEFDNPEPTTSGGSDQFATALAGVGTIIVVGARADDSAAADAGTVY